MFHARKHTTTRSATWDKSWTHQSGLLFYTDKLWFNLILLYDMFMTSIITSNRTNCLMSYELEKSAWTLAARNTPPLRHWEGMWMGGDGGP